MERGVPRVRPARGMSSFKQRPLLGIHRAEKKLRSLEHVFDFHLLRADRHRRVVATAFDRCSFDFSKFRHGLDATGGGRLRVRPISAMGFYKPKARVLEVGFFEPGYWSGKNDWKLQTIALHELGHAVDFLVLTGEHRDEIFNALHPGAPEHHPNGSALEEHEVFSAAVALDKRTPHGHGHRWWDSTYEESVGEAFAETFIEATSDLNIGAGFEEHPITPGAVDAVRRVLSS